MGKSSKDNFEFVQKKMKKKKINAYIIRKPGHSFEKLLQFLTESAGNLKTNYVLCLIRQKSYVIFFLCFLGSCFRNFCLHKISFSSPLLRAKML